MICFLNSLFNGAQVIRDVKYLNNEHLGDSSVDRKAIFDVYCEGENGEKFIVEMQNAYQEFHWKNCIITCRIHSVQAQNETTVCALLSVARTVALL